MNKVTLQINVTADDLKHCKYLLYHQLDIFHQQVDEVLLTFDTQPRKIFDEDIFLQNNRDFRAFIDEFIPKYKKARLHEIDYSKDTIDKITGIFYTKPVPTHDYRGAPIYGYLYGICEAKNDYVIHIDSDMFFGGMSNTWIKEAIELLKSDNQILSVSPLPGPPHPEKKLIKQIPYFNYKNKEYYFGFRSLSTRIFLCNRKNLYGKLRFHRPKLRDWAFSIYEKLPTIETLEITIEKYMRRSNLIRVDFMGKGNGLWSIHPSYRSDEFYAKIPEMIERVVKNDVPKSQLGYYDFSLDFIDWSDALADYTERRMRTKILRKLGLKRN